VHRKVIVVSAALGGLALLATMALAAVSVKFSMPFSPAQPGKSGSVTVNFESTDLAAPQPPVMNRVQIKFPVGGKWNGAKFPKCKLAVLQARGPSGCPAGSKYGSGTGSGYARPVVGDIVRAKLTVFNGGGKEIYVYVFPDLGPTFVTVCKIVGGYNLDCNIPPIKTLPSAPDAAVASVKVKSTPKSIKKGKRKIGLLVTPKTCDGSWRSVATFSFVTGEKVTVPFSQKCKK
jgi:hypothetical protein